MALVTAAVIGAVAAVGTAYMSYRQGKEQKKAIKAQQRQADIANARERRFAVRNARIARASVESQAATTGLVGSSAAAASMANIQGRLGENLSFLDQNQMLSAQASRANENAATWGSRVVQADGAGGCTGWGRQHCGRQPFWMFRAGSMGLGQPQQQRQVGTDVPSISLAASLHPRSWPADQLWP